MQVTAQVKGQNITLSLAATSFAQQTMPSAEHMATVNDDELLIGESKAIKFSPDAFLIGRDFHHNKFLNRKKVLQGMTACHFTVTVAAVKKYAPGKLAYINLDPNYATLWQMDQIKSQLGTKTYTEYLERFVNEVKPQVMSYDNYMVEFSMDLENKEKAAGYFTNLVDVRRIASKYNLPF